ncbi:PaaI family thioesterase [Streptomyces rubiginosohelvolus]|uniref:PaaI family thioesterase n=1 Tax=Streptomyces rubiginosohelvolus TaxID=67362 RepID=UPI00343DC949
MDHSQQHASPATQKRVRDSFDRQGLLALLGARLTHIGPGRVHIVLPTRPEVTQQHGYIHTGATSAIADSAGCYAALTLLAENVEALTVEYKINLLAPAAGTHLEAIGSVIKSGRTLTVCELEVQGVTADGARQFVAHGQQTLIHARAKQ